MVAELASQDHMHRSGGKVLTVWISAQRERLVSLKGIGFWSQMREPVNCQPTVEFEERMTVEGKRLNWCVHIEPGASHKWGNRGHLLLDGQWVIFRPIRSMEWLVISKVMRVLGNLIAVWVLAAGGGAVALLNIFGLSYAATAYRDKCIGALLLLWSPKKIHTIWNLIRRPASNCDSAHFSTYRVLCQWSSLTQTRLHKESWLTKPISNWCTILSAPLYQYIKTALSGRYNKLWL